VAFEPDGRLYGHARLGFGDLRIVDAKDDQVPWRPLPEAPPAPPEQVRVLNSGRRGGEAVATLDLGSGRQVHDRLDLEVAGQDFVGRATVFGSDDRRTFTNLGSTRIFALQGAAGEVRSTTVTFSPTDLRYLEVRATGVSRILGATVFGKAQRPTLRLVAGRMSVRQLGRRTRVVVDLGYANVPVDELQISSTTARYDRALVVEADNGFPPAVTTARIFRYYGTASPPLSLDVRARRLRITISNGDDPPLRGLRVEVLARPRPLLVEGGHPQPLRVLYGGRRRDAPDYDVARLPRDVLALDRLRRGALGPETVNADFEPAPDTRSFVKRHPVLVDAALALAAAVLGVGGFLALRRRA
jgi:hypothetical protein